MPSPPLLCAVTSRQHLLQCDTSSSDDNKPYGWTEGTDHSTDVSVTGKHRKKRRTNPPPPPKMGKGGRPNLAQASLSCASLGRDPQVPQVM